MEAKIEKMQERFNKDPEELKKQTPRRIKEQTNRDEQFNN